MSDFSNHWGGIGDVYGPLQTYMPPTDPTPVPPGMTDMTGFNTGGSFNDILNQITGGGTSPSMDAINQMVNTVNSGPATGSLPAATTGGGGGGNMLSQILQSLGMTNGNGSTNWMSILGALAPLLAGGLSSHATNQATQQTMDAIKNAQNELTGIYKQNQPLFTPYVNVGPAALSGLQGMVGHSNLAPMFPTLGSGRGITLGQMAGK